MRSVTLLVFVLGLAISQPAEAQLLADTLYSWRGYLTKGTCRLLIYAGGPESDRDRVVVMQELAENKGPTVVSDIAFLTEAIARTYDIEPETAFWIVHWGAFSFEGAGGRRKELFLRATFKKTGQGRLGAPQWRVVEREDLDLYTDRAFR
ncbi:MAG: hypothetical protein R2834_20310 [Rhodothermales bacterium]